MLVNHGAKMKILNMLGTVFFFITTPIWWPLMVIVEVVQIMTYRPSYDKLLGPVIYDWLQRNKTQGAA